MQQIFQFLPKWSDSQKDTGQKGPLFLPLRHLRGNRATRKNLVNLKLYIAIRLIITHFNMDPAVVMKIQRKLKYKVIPSLKVIIMNVRRLFLTVIMMII